MRPRLGQSDTFSNLCRIPEQSRNMQKPLSDAYLRTLATPQAGRLEISDSRCTGLSFRVTSLNARSWSFRFRDPLTLAPLRMTLGKYPDVGLADARARATELRREVAAGRNPIEEKRKARHAAETESFGALAE